jgi:hypothetical protein
VALAVTTARRKGSDTVGKGQSQRHTKPEKSSRGASAIQSLLLRPTLNMPDIKLGDTVPDFEQESTHGKIKFYDYLGDSWGILFSHPKDYTVRHPLCPTGRSSSFLFTLIR